MVTKRLGTTGLTGTYYLLIYVAESSNRLSSELSIFAAAAECI